MANVDSLHGHVSIQLMKGYTEIGVTVAYVGARKRAESRGKRYHIEGSLVTPPLLVDR